MFNKFLLLALLITSTQSFAGQDGNGGFGLECGEKITLLDLYEATERYNYTIDLGPANSSVDEKVELMLKRISKVNRYAAALYRQKYKNLWSRAIILKGRAVVKNEDILVGKALSYRPDIGSAILPENCELIALARNLTATQGELNQNIFFMGKYWDRLDNNNKAALILHELIYFDYVSGQMPEEIRVAFDQDKGSSPVRKMIAYAASKEADTMTPRQILNAFSRFNGSDTWFATLFKYDINGFNVDSLSSVKFSKDETYVELFTRGRESKISKFSSRQTMKWGDKIYDLTIAEENYYTYPFTFLAKDLPAKFTIGDFSVKLGSEGYYSKGSTTIILYSNKSVKIIANDNSYYTGGVVSSKNPLKALFDKKIVKSEHLPRIFAIEFYLDGKVRCVHTEKSIVVDVKGKFLNVTTQQLHLDLNGNLLDTTCRPNTYK